MVEKTDQDKAESRGISRRTYLRSSGLLATGVATVPVVRGAGVQQNPLEIWLGVYTEGKTKRQYIDNLVKKFENQFGIPVNVSGVPYSKFTTKMQAAAAAGNQPHLAEISANTGTLRFARSINDIFSKSKTGEKASSGLVEAHKTWGGQISGEKGTLLTWPLGLRPHIPTWRMDWLEQAGIDRTEVNHEAGGLHWYDDVEPIYERLKQTELGQKEGHYPSNTSMKKSDEEFLSIYLAQFGAGLGGVVNETGTRSVLDTKEAHRAIQHQIDFMDKGHFHPNSINWGDEESTTAQWSGKVAEIHNQDTADLWSEYLSEKPKMMKNHRFTWGLPFTGQKSEPPATLVKTPSVAFMDGAFENQKQVDNAVQFLDYWSVSEEIGVKNAKNLGFAPASPEIIQNADFFGKTELHKRFWRGAVAKTLEESRFANVSAVPSKAINYEIPSKMHQRIVTQGMSVEKAANMAAEEINKKLKEQSG